MVWPRAWALLVAIVMLSGCSDRLHGPGQSPTVDFAVDEALDQLVVQTTSDDVLWKKVFIQVTGCRLSGEDVTVVLGNFTSGVNRPATGHGIPVGHAEGDRCRVEPVKIHVGEAKAVVVAGDFLEFCANGQEGAQATDLAVSVFYEGEAKALDYATLALVASC